MFAVPNCVKSAVGYVAPVFGGVLDDDFAELERTHRALNSKASASEVVVEDDNTPVSSMDTWNAHAVSKVAEVEQHGGGVWTQTIGLDTKVDLLPPSVEAVGSTRVELHVNNPDGSRTLLASVDSRDGAAAGVIVEKSLEDKIREAMASNAGTVIENPMASALVNAKKNHH